MTELEKRLYWALCTIAAYDPPARLRKSREWGLSSEEAIEMAYENVLLEAKRAIKGVRLRKAKPRATLAQGTEARRAETALAGSVEDDGPVGEADALGDRSR